MLVPPVVGPQLGWRAVAHAMLCSKCRRPSPALPASGWGDTRTACSSSTTTHAPGRPNQRRIGVHCSLLAHDSQPLSAASGCRRHSGSLSCMGAGMTRSATPTRSDDVAIEREDLRQNGLAGACRRPARRWLLRALLVRPGHGRTSCASPEKGECWCLAALPSVLFPSDARQPPPSRCSRLRPTRMR